MASEYDFRNLESKFDRLESKYTSFESKGKDVITTSKNLRFDERTYGASAVDKRVRTILNDAKRKLNSSINSCINTINRYAHTSKEKVKSEARSFDIYVTALNKTLEIIQSINSCFGNKEYEKVITLINNNSSIEAAGNPKIAKYLALLKITSMDKLCDQYLSEFDGLHIAFFEDYVSACKQLGADKHKPVAIAKAIQYFTKYIKYSSESKEQSYYYAKLGLAYYLELDEKNKEACKANYSYLYSTMVNLFNELSAKPYEEFDYQKVMVFLNDSKLIAKSDIANDFFKSQDCSIMGRFKYLTLKYNKANHGNLLLAIDDTIALVSGENKVAYYTFWFKNAEFFKWTILQVVFEKQEPLFSLKENIENAIVVCGCIADISIDTYTKELIGYAVAYYYDFIMKNRKTIPLLAFLKMSISVCKLCDKLTPNDEDSYSEYKKISSIIFATIKKNIKYCAGLDSKLKDELDVVYRLTAEVIDVKTPKKTLSAFASSKILTDDIVVKVETYDSQNKKKKALWIGLGVCAGVALLIAVLLIIFLS